jgi:hypothetical protein
MRPDERSYALAAIIGGLPEQVNQPVGTRLQDHLRRVTRCGERLTMSGDEDAVHEALSAGLKQLSGSNKLTVAQFGADEQPVVWQVYRDENGTPKAVRLFVRPAVLRNPNAFYSEIKPAFIVRTSTSLSDELVALLPGSRRVPVFECQTSLEEQLREAIRISPLVLGYELAVLRQVPDGRPDAGSLALAGHLLFPVGLGYGDQVKVRVRCEPTDGDGTVFAVVTRDPRPNVSSKDRELRPVQIQSAAVPPGTYEVTAEVTRPGRVVLRGLPAVLSKSPVSPEALWAAWEDLKTRVPRRLQAVEPVHLICLLEVTGGEDTLKERILRLEQLITAAEAGGGELRVSVIGYGPHAVAWAVQEEPITVQAWAVSGQEAMAKMRGLSGRKADEREYQRAAQLECVLQGLAARLSELDGRLVLVTVGGRPPHPPGMDTRTQIIPCPQRVSWSRQLDRLTSLRMSFGALRDPNSGGEIWRTLGRDAAAMLDDPVDMTNFAAALGLREPAQAMPFPFIDQGEGAREWLA